MEFEALKAWLTGQAEKQAKACRRKGVWGCVFCPVVLVLSACFIHAIIQRFSFNRGDRTVYWLISFGVLPLLFLGNRLMAPTEVLEDRLGDPEGRAWSRLGPGRGLVGLLILCWVLFTGPKLWDWARESFREARLWREQDTHSCAAVLWLLASRFKRVPHEEVQREIPWLNLEALLPELARIPGVLNLKGPPPGLALNDDLRKAIRTGGDLEPGPGDLQLH